MSYCLSVQSESLLPGQHPFEKTIQLQDVKEFEYVRLLCADRTNMAGFFKWSMMPIRTDLKYLCRDLFIPTFINTAKKANNYSKFLFEVIAIIWDLITLPFRIITLPFRVAHNLYTKPEAHPLIHYLNATGIFRSNFNINNEFEIKIYKEEQEPAIDKCYGTNTIQTGELHILYLTDREVPYLASSNVDMIFSRVGPRKILFKP